MKYLIAIAMIAAATSAYAATNATVVYEDERVKVECGVSNGQQVCITQYKR